MSDQIKFYNYHEYAKINPQSLVTDFPNSYNSQSGRIIRIPRIYNSDTGDAATSYPQFSEFFPGNEPGALHEEPFSSKSKLSEYLTEKELEEIVTEVNTILKDAFNVSWRSILFNTIALLTFWIISFNADIPYEKKLSDFIKTLNVRYSSRHIEFIDPKKSAYLSFDILIPDVDVVEIESHGD